MKRLLFVSESVTLAQVVRLKALADSLDPARFEIHFACSRFHDMIFSGSAFRRWPITSVSDERMKAASLRGSRIYDEKILSGYIEEDRAVLAEVRPDLVIGDLRWSLSVSAPVEKVPYAALINAYWSRGSHQGRFPLPDHPTAKWLGPAVAGWFFPLARPWVFAHHARPLNRLRRRHGLPPLGNLDEILTHGDYTLFPDVPGLVPLAHREENQRYLGPLLWSPQIPTPAWWDEIPADSPIAYVTPGSSGRADRLPTVCEGLGRLGLAQMVSTAGGMPAPEAAGVWSAPFLPGQLAARRARLVVCHGGSTTAYQALAEGVPVLGVPSNLDQYLSMRAIVESGAGLSLRADSLRAGDVAFAARRLLVEPSFRLAAAKVREEFARYPATKRFHDFLEEVLPC